MVAGVSSVVLGSSTDKAVVAFMFSGTSTVIVHSEEVTAAEAFNAVIVVFIVEVKASSVVGEFRCRFCCRGWHNWRYSGGSFCICS